MRNIEIPFSKLEKILKKEGITELQENEYISRVSYQMTYPGRVVSVGIDTYSDEEMKAFEEMGVK